MGYDTTLSVGGRQIAAWRKHASARPRVLFRFEDLRVSTLPEDYDGDESHPSVEFNATVATVRATLEAAGFGWPSIVSIYSEIRADPSNVHAMYRGAQRASETLGDRRLPSMEELGAQDPEHELRDLAALLKSQWSGEDADLLIFDEISYDSPIDNPSETLMRLVDAVIYHKEPNVTIHAARAFEGILFLYQDAPLVAWPILVSILLSALDAELTVTLDLSDAAWEWGADTEELAVEYAKDYWSWTTASLSSYASSLGRIFNILASFDNQLGREFWFSRAQDAFARLELASSSRSNLTTKELGDALEAVVDALVRTEQPQLTVIERNFRTAEEEIDLVLANDLPQPFWTSQSSPFIFVECKNHAKSIGVADLRVFESKIEDRKAVCKLGVFISFSGFTKPFMERLKVIQGRYGLIFAVTGGELRQLLTRRVRVTDWLRTDGARKALGREVQTDS